MKKFYLALSMLAMATAFLTGCKSEDPTKFVLATYNIRFEGQGDYDNGNGWSTRRDYVSQLILFHDFDILIVIFQIITQHPLLQKYVVHFLLIQSSPFLFLLLIQTQKSIK